VEVWQTSNLRLLRLGEEKKEERRRKIEITGQKYNGNRATITTTTKQQQQLTLNVPDESLTR